MRLLPAFGLIIVSYFGSVFISLSLSFNRFLTLSIFICSIPARSRSWPRSAIASFVLRRCRRRTIVWSWSATWSSWWFSISAMFARSRASHLRSMARWSITRRRGGTWSWSRSTIFFMIFTIAFASSTTTFFLVRIIFVTTACLPVVASGRRRFYTLGFCRRGHRSPVRVWVMHWWCMGFGCNWSWLNSGGRSFVNDGTMGELLVSHSVLWVTEPRGFAFRGPSCVRVSTEIGKNGKCWLIMFPKLFSFM